MNLMNIENGSETLKNDRNEPAMPDCSKDLQAETESTNAPMWK